LEKGQNLFAGQEATHSGIQNEGKTQADAVVRTAREKADDLLQNAEQMLRDAKSKAQHSTNIVSDGISRIKDADSAGVDAFKQEMSNIPPHSRS